MTALIFFICFSASAIGSVCGIGGGIIIKPALDAIQAMPADAINFLSGVTVLCMTSTSLVRQKKTRSIDMSVALPLGIGASLGGIAGKYLLHYLLRVAPRANYATAIQSALLAVVTAATLIYTALSQKTDRPPRVHGVAPCVLTGCALGMMSSFLGIGGGHINLTVLLFLFSLDVKHAAVYSLFIIFLSQASGLALTIALRAIPTFLPQNMIVMVAAGVFGGLAGSAASARLSQKNTSRILQSVLICITILCLYNFFTQWRAIT